MNGLALGNHWGRDLRRWISSWGVVRVSERSVVGIHKSSGLMHVKRTRVGRTT